MYCVPNKYLRAKYIDTQIKCIYLFINILFITHYCSVLSLVNYKVIFPFVLKLMIIHCHCRAPKQREVKFKPRTKLNHNIYMLYIGQN